MKTKPIYIVSCKIQAVFYLSMMVILLLGCSSNPPSSDIVLARDQAEGWWQAGSGQAKTGQIDERSVNIPNMSDQGMNENHTQNTMPDRLAPPTLEERRQANLPDGFDDYRTSNQTKEESGQDATPKRRPFGRPNIDIALLVPLSGPHSEVGFSLQEGAELGLFIADSQGQFAMASFDTGGATEQEAREATKTAYDRAISLGAKVILGPLLAENIQVIGGLERNKRIPVLSFSNDEQTAQSGIFVTGSLPGQQLKAVLQTALQQGRRKFAYIGPDNFYGRYLESKMRELLTGTQARMVQAWRYGEDEVNFDEPIRNFANYDARRQALFAERARLQAIANNDQAKSLLRRLQNADSFGEPPFDALLLGVNDPTDLLTIAAQLNVYDVDKRFVQFIGLEPWGLIPNLTREPSLDEAIYPVRLAPDDQRFRDLFEKNYMRPPKGFAGLGFDMMVVATRWLERGGQWGQLVTRAGYNGANGVFRLNEDGVIERNYGVVKISRNERRLIAPIPRNFPEIRRAVFPQIQGQKIIIDPSTDISQ